MSKLHEHKPQLHQRVMHRRSELEATLALLEQDELTRTSPRAQAVADALAVLDSNLSAGWEHVGEVEAAQLARWLDNTPVLIETAVEPAQAEAIFRHLEGRWHLESAGFPMQNFQLEPAPPNAVTQTMKVLSPVAPSDTPNPTSP